MPFLRPIFGNTISLRKLITLAYFVVVARYAGVNITGLFYLVICYGSLFHVVIDLGLTRLFIRNASRKPDRLDQRLSEVLSIKLLLAALGVVGTIGLLHWLQYPLITNRLIYIVVVTMVLQSFADTFYACFRALHNMRYEAAGMVAGKLVMLSLGGVAVLLGLSPYFLILALALDAMVNFLIGLYLVRRRLKLALTFTFLPTLFARNVSTAGPFALSALFAQVYAFDGVVLQKFMGEPFVALYGVAARPVSSLHFVPAMLGVVLFPLFSSAYQSDRQNLSATFINSQHAMLVIVAPLVAWGVAGSPTIIQLLFGSDYSSSATPLQIMTLSLPAIFLTYPLLALLNGCNRQQTAVRHLAFALTSHVMLSVWLIPRFGVVGAAIASTLSTMVLTASCSYSASRLLTSYSRGFGNRVLRVSVATVPMLVVLLLAHGRTNFAIAMLLSGGVYAAGLYLEEGIHDRRFRAAVANQRISDLARTLFPTR